MASWIFATNRQGWGTVDAIWTGDDGHPPGCIAANNGIEGLSISVTPDSPCSFWCKIIWDSTDDLVVPVGVDVRLRANDDLVDLTGSRSIVTLPYDSGWFKVAGNALGTGTVETLSVEIGSDMPDWPGSALVDSIYVAETEPESGTCKFYQGTNSLTERFEMPFTQVSAPALALRQDGAVAIGNGNAAGENQVIVIFPANYADYDDYTRNHDAEGVKRMVWVK